MTSTPHSAGHPHGPENAEHEIRKAYRTIIHTATVYFPEKRPIPEDANAYEAINIYKHGYNQLRHGNRLAAERWARTAKHLGRALFHEAEIAYLEVNETELPYLLGATEEEFEAHERFDTTADLIESVAEHVPPGLDAMPEEMKRYLVRARQHLEVLRHPDYKHELLRAERLKAAHEYGRVLECMALAYEAEQPLKPTTQPKTAA